MASAKRQFTFSAVAFLSIQAVSLCKMQVKVQVKAAASGIDRRGGVMIYSFTTAGKIIFGRGAVKEIGRELSVFGRKALLVTGSRSFERYGIMEKLLNPLQSAGIEVVLFNRAEREPSLNTVRKGLDELKIHKCDFVIGAGGGSAIDVAKAIAGLANVNRDIAEYFEDAEVERKGLPFVAIPTTAGSGAELTNNAVLSDWNRLVKKSIRSPYLMADLVLADPELTRTLPPDITAESGMDALTQAIEGYTSKWANPLTETLSLKAVELIGRSIEDAFMDGADMDAREKMLLGSMMAAMAFTNCRLGAVHGLAHPIGIKYGIPHGKVCAVLLPWVMRFNLTVSSEKYMKVAEALIPDGSDPAEGLAHRGSENQGSTHPAPEHSVTAESAIKRIEELNRRFGIPEKLGDLGLAEEDIGWIADESLPSGSLKANPREVTREDIVDILRKNLKC